MSHRLLPLSLFFLCAVFCIAAARRVSAQTTPSDILKQRYDAKVLRILIVPGHDDDSTGGARFAGIKEADINLQLAKHLAAYLTTDGHFAVSITRDDAGYLTEFINYFQNQREEIATFRERAKAAIESLVEQGTFTPRTIVKHNFASAEDAEKLHGINKWVIDHSIDLVIHIHFNDYPGRPRNQESTYSGVSIYIPEKQLPNHAASRAIGQSIFSALTRYIHPSTNPVEKDGIIEDQELIAIGPYGSLAIPALLIEYSYISEPQISRTSRIRRPILKEMAYQTYRGITLHFNPDADLFLASSSFLPRRWTSGVREGMRENTEVLALQFALSHEALYPPPGYLPHDCLLTGTFGPCTRDGVKAFQKKYVLPATGIVGPMTLAMLNDIYDYPIPQSAEQFTYTWKTDLAYGMKNSPAVGALQNALLLEKLYDARITGDFLDATRDALHAFQEREALTPIPPSGYAGPRTRKILNERYGSTPR